MIDKELENYYRAYRDMFMSDGWKQLQEDLMSNANIINSVEACKDGNDLSFRKGQLAIIGNIVNLEQQMNKDLLSPSEQGRYFTEYNVDGLLRGDTKSRYQAYGQARRDGWLNADEIRGKENLPPLEGDQGKTYIVGRNMIDLSLLSDEETLKTGGSTNGTGASAAATE